MLYEPVIGLEVHAELATRSKMFCSCPVIDSTQAAPNTTVCPVCAGMPGVLPVVNQQAVAYAIRVALALQCKVAHTSIFARKNYFYPDLPKGYQISQYEYPLAENGQLVIETSSGEKIIRIRRAHLEEDTGKLTHVRSGEDAHSLVDLNRAGVPLLEIVSEPDMHSVEDVRAYATSLRAILRALGVNSGDMEKGVIRFEANVSIRPAGSTELGTRVEIKNLNSFRAMERGILYQIEQQTRTLESGGKVSQETLGWDEASGTTYSQRSKEDAHDYRYFPEPDLPPLVVEQSWVDEIAAGLPELPQTKVRRYIQELGLSAVDAALIASDLETAYFFERAVCVGEGLPPKTLANWITGELYAWMNLSAESFASLKITPAGLADLLGEVQSSRINLNTAKIVLNEMLQTGASAAEIIQARGLEQISDQNQIADWVRTALENNPAELKAYLSGKETLANWFFGQVMRTAGGKTNPSVVRAELERQLAERKGNLV